jgi:hypothetical protein
MALSLGRWPLLRLAGQDAFCRGLLSDAGADDRFRRQSEL